MSKVSRCRLENVENLDASEIKYSSSLLRKKIQYIWNYADFDNSARILRNFFTETNSESNKNGN